MRVVDSSGWLEFFTDGPRAGRYAAYLSDPSEVVTPTVVLYEVFKKVKRERNDEEAMQVAAYLYKTRLAPLTESIALMAADISLEYKLAMADAIIYATARAHSAEIVTSDADLSGLPDVTYISKPR
jgi:predicted nucleic acid-binding protein